MSKSRSDH